MNKEKYIGILIVTISIILLFIYPGISIIWIGGFIWGGSIIAGTRNSKSFLNSIKIPESRKLPYKIIIIFAIIFCVLFFIYIQYTSR